MKIVTRLRQLLANKPVHPAPSIIDAPQPTASPPQPSTRPAVERPETPSPLQLPPVSPTKQGYLLEGEGIAEPLPDPSPVIIRQELERLRTAGPSFVILIAPNGSFLQAAGNSKRMTVESHSVSAQHTNHVVLGRPGSSGPVATVVATFGPIEVHAPEVWAAPEVSELFVEFAQTGTIPIDLNRRDITVAIATA